MAVRWVVLVILLAGLAGACQSVSPSDHYQKGLQGLQTGDWDTARKEFDAAKTYQDAPRRAAEAQEKSATVATAYDKAAAATKQGDWPTALAQLEIVVGLSPNYKDAPQQRQHAVEQLDTIVS